MTPFRDLEWKAADLVCSGCGACAVSVYLRCDGADRECVARASCHNCGQQFEAETLTTHSERYEALVRLASQDPCPHCGALARVVRSICDRATRECRFLLECASCGEVRVA